MYALRERRVHVTQEDFEMAVAKVSASLVCLCCGGSEAGVAGVKLCSQFINPCSHMYMGSLLLPSPGHAKG